MGILAYDLVQPPLRRKPWFVQRAARAEPLLDLPAAAYAAHVRMSDARILVDFAEEILAIYPLEPSTPQAGKRKPKPVELLFLPIGDERDCLRRRQSAEIRKAFPDAISGPWTGHHVLGFRRVDELGVVQVSGELIREELTDAGTLAQQFKHRLKRSYPSELSREPTFHHC